METTLLKGLQLLEALVNSDEPRGITDLAAELGLTKSNVHRLMQTLAHAGFVRQQPDTERYTCTAKLWKLGSIVADRIDLVPLARPFLKALARTTRETVFLTIREGADALYVSKEDSPQPVRTFAELGGRAPLYAVATGKAMLAHLPDADVAGVLANLERSSTNTITDPATLRAQLRRVRKMGFAVNRGEWRDGVCSIASPIFDAAGRVCAAIGVSAPTSRLTADAMTGLSPAVIQTAADISRALGFDGVAAQA